MIFSRYLAHKRGPFTLRLNQQLVHPWDPFLSDMTWTQRLPHENLRVRDEPMLVQPYVLPYYGKLTAEQLAEAAGPLGWNAQQGFYVYRNDRLITAGTWLGLPGINHSDVYNLARISVDIPPSLDREWSINITKGAVRPPPVLRTDLVRIAAETRRRARKVLKSRGGLVGRKAKRAIIPVWQQRRRHGELVLNINRQHPMIAEILASENPSRRQVAAIIDLIEETIPTAALPSVTAIDRSTIDGAPPESVIQLAKHLYEKFLLDDGLTRQQAADKLMNFEPFDKYPDLIEMI
jgi:hypothetical protein